MGTGHVHPKLATVTNTAFTRAASCSRRSRYDVARARGGAGALIKITREPRSTPSRVSPSTTGGTVPANSGILSLVGASKKKGAPPKKQSPKRSTEDRARQPRWSVRLPAEMHERAERLEELITERVQGSGLELAMMYDRFPTEAETRLLRMERAWHLLNGTDGDAATTLLLAIELTAAAAGKKGRMDDAEWIESHLLHTVREFDDASSFAEELEKHPSKPLGALVDVVQLRGRNADRHSSGEDDDGKTARWVLKFAALMNKLRPVDWPVVAGTTADKRIKKMRVSIGWPSAAKLKIRTRRPRKKPARE